MSGLRFKVGELARIACTGVNAFSRCVGEIVEIEDIGPWTAGDIHKGQSFPIATDYTILFRGISVGCLDINLQKIDPPAEPACLTRESECGVEA